MKYAKDIAQGVALYLRNVRSNDWSMDYELDQWAQGKSAWQVQAVRRIARRILERNGEI